ncbi:hypothetical protein B0J14DRAFT_644383 [Halenospora varia]|nr:hypothetical protein B0J14DRAFT_644383 [Halenospora varia]
MSRIVKEISNKKVRQFYQTQNEKLNDWLEVNVIVKVISDDILESFNPRDDNGDGIAEGGGALQDTAGCVEPFLPQEEQEKRRVGRRNAKWAININVVANIILVIAKAVATFYSSSLSLIASFADSALNLLCTESAEELMSKGPHKATQLPPIAIGALAATIGLKGIIGLGCMRIKTTQVQALAQGKFLLIYDWGTTCFESIFRLTGSTPADRLHENLTFMAWRFSPLVNGYKSVNAYYASDGV